METVKYITSILTFYLKGEISADANFIKFKEPNTILGLIPLGAKKESIPINQISSTQTNFKLKIGKLLIGIFILILGFTLFEDSSTIPVALIFLIFAFNTVMDAFEIDLNVNMTSGDRKTIDFFIFDKQKAEAAERGINNLIANRLNDTNTRQQTDRIIDAINNN